MIPIKIFLVLGLFLSGLPTLVNAQHPVKANQTLDSKQQAIVTISALTARGDLTGLQKALGNGLEAGLTVNQIKEVLVHLYAYCGFPRSIRGLQTFMLVLEERKAKGINDREGPEASPISEERSKYERGKDILEKLTGAPQEGPLRGYSAFAPTIDTFLKEHLFADIFERDVLSYAERELVTLSVLSSIGGVEPMLQGHLNISLNVGLSPSQLHQLVTTIKSMTGTKEAESAQSVLDEVLKNHNPGQTK